MNQNSENTQQKSSAQPQRALRVHYKNPFFMKEEEEEQKQYHKLYQPYWLYFIVYICELLTILLSILLLVVDKQHKPYVYLTYIIMTAVRVSVWISNSIYLIGLSRPLLRMYFLIDNNLLFGMGTCITYLAYNAGNPIQFKYAAMVCYPILVFFLNGNYRVMLMYCKWDRWQYIMYKCLKLFGAIYFLVYGAYVTKNQSILQPDLFLLYVFTTFAYYSQMYFGINRLDASDTLIPDYQIQGTIEQSDRLMNKNLIEHNQNLK